MHAGIAGLGRGQAIFLRSKHTRASRNGNIREEESRMLFNRISASVKLYVYRSQFRVTEGFFKVPKAREIRRPFKLKGPDHAGGGPNRGQEQLRTASSLCVSKGRTRPGASRWHSETAQLIVQARVWTWPRPKVPARVDDKGGASPAKESANGGKAGGSVSERERRGRRGRRERRERRERGEDNKQ
ncbi:hypothetical protein H6P81_001690 [Aristolochia fimbriata]|uniref:Uncharacterized protein n=1 Tax=Aristolochia fimbriata TaxID=158543 RepID=A0AAV7FAV5_ARIFI|nr:hypothetical protein H6P81_001690 [Aristolochia fimbriata]